MFNKLKSFLPKSKQAPINDASEEDIFNRYVPTNYILNQIGCNTASYDNTFPNITRIAEAFAEVLPYAVDERGEKLKEQPRLIKVLYNPNKEMSGRDFFETIAVMMLVHPVVPILCWHEERGEIVPGGPITPDNIAAFTFLEGAAISRINGVTTYDTGEARWTDRDVISLSMNVNPYDLLKGYSPSQAIKKWATTDDYIADYQNATFRNGATPAGIFTITAPSVEAYNKAVDEMQRHHRGAGNANNVMYTHRPASSIDGKPAAAGVEWTPFAQTNKDLTLDAIFNQANQKIDMNFGVPEEVKGHLSNSTYASAEVADYIFSRRVIYPKLVKIWSKFTHGFNMVSGGAGFAISFDYEVPVLTDTRKLQAETLQLMTNAGYTLESAVEALQLPKSFLKLEESEQQKPAENAEVQTTTEEKPSQAETTKAVKSKLLEGDLVSPENPDAPPVDTQLLAAVATLLNIAIDEAVRLIREMFKGDKKSVGAIITQLKKDIASDQKNEDDIIIAIILYLMNRSGQEAMTEFADRLKLEDSSFLMGAGDLSEVRKRIEKLLEEFNQQTIDKIDETLNNSVAANMSADDTALTIEALKQSEAYRAERWARSEEHIADNTAVLIAARMAAEKSNNVAYKIWRINPESPDICPLCVRMSGERVRLGETFSNGDMIPHRHPHCYCYAEIVFENEKSVKVCCPKCGRYVMESTGGVMKNVICTNSKCKMHFDVEVSADGKIKSKEVKP